MRSIMPARHRCMRSSRLVERFSCILYDFFGVFILAKSKCLELTTSNLLIRTQSINTLVSRTWTLRGVVSMFNAHFGRRRAPQCSHDIIMSFKQTCNIILSLKTLTNIIILLSDIIIGLAHISMASALFSHGRGTTTVREHNPITWRVNEMKHVLAAYKHFLWVFERYKNVMNHHF